MSINNGLTSALAACISALLLSLSATAASPAEQAESSAGSYHATPNLNPTRPGQSQQVAQMPVGAPNVNVAPTLPGAANNPAAINDTNQNRAPYGNNAPMPESAIGAGGITVTTTPQIDGYHVRRYLGIVRGVRVFQPTIGESFKASFKGIIGGNIGSYVEMAEKAREQAYDLMLDRCTTLGANAVLGFRYDNAAFSVNSSEMGTEVICYGTAVYLEANR